MKLRSLLALLLCLASLSLAANRVIDMRDYGIVPGTATDMSGRMQRALEAIHRATGGRDVTLRFAPGVYHFHPDSSFRKEYYISNHDQPNPRHVAICLDRWQNLVIEAEGMEMICHGRMLPLALTHSSHTALRGLSIDFATPHIAQVVIEANTDSGMVYRVEPWVNARISSDGHLETWGEGWTNIPQGGIAFEENTRHLVYRTSDLWCPTDSTVSLSDHRFRSPKWHDSRLLPGTRVALRTYARPAPAIFLDCDTTTSLHNITVHYAEGMGLLAQVCRDIEMDGFRVALRGNDDPRYFTTQADATHFSGCSGRIVSKRGLYEGMMDDAINVHGTYLKVVERVAGDAVRARYMHPQSYGFHWGSPGDSVQIIRSSTMELIDGAPWRITDITPADTVCVAGAKEFIIRFSAPLPAELSASEGFGLENLSLCPEVYFTGNVVRNNRARGSLFSTPLTTVVEDNLFDHTSGTAILLCGDCNGWYETGACRDVQIRRNRFVNALTNMFQFTEAVISIYPEIPDLDHQTLYFHGGHGAPGIVIEDNLFETFDQPILFACSVDGIIFRNNRIVRNTDYPPFHRNRQMFTLKRVVNFSTDSCEEQ